MPISALLAERAIRPWCVGRRSWLFCDTPSGAAASCAAYSVVTTARANGLDDRRYFEWLLAEMPDDASLRHKGAVYYLDGHDPDPVYLQSGFVTSREVRRVIEALRNNYVNVRKRSIFEEIDDEYARDRRRPIGKSAGGSSAKSSRRQSAGPSQGSTGRSPAESSDGSSDRSSGSRKLRFFPRDDLGD